MKTTMTPFDKKHSQIRHYLIIALYLLLHQVATAQNSNIGDIFVDAPQQITPTLTNSEKLELWAYYQSEKRDTLKNRFGTTVKILSVDTLHRHIRLQTTDNETVEIIALHHSDSSTTIGVIHTVCIPICSSYIQLYDHKWQPIPLPFSIPTTQAWHIPQPTDPQPYETPNTDFIEIRFDAQRKEVLFTNNSLKLLGQTQQENAQKHFSTHPIVRSLESISTTPQGDKK